MSINRRNLLKMGGATAFCLASTNTAHAMKGGGLFNYTPVQAQPAEVYFHPELATNSKDPVGIAWTICIDNSGSLTDDEYHAQLDALADVFWRDDFRESLFFPGGPGSAAICVIDFGTDSVLLTPWIDFREDDRNKFQHVAKIIQELPRRANGSTNHHTALDNSMICFDQMQRRWESNDKHVPIMTDGTGPPTGIEAHRKALAERFGAVISSLITTGSEANLFEWCDDHLTTPNLWYTGPNGQSVKGGVTVEVATEKETQGTNIARYKDRVFQVFRDQITTHTAHNLINDLRNDTRFAGLIDDNLLRSKDALSIDQAQNFMAALKDHNQAANLVAPHQPPIINFG